MERRQFWERVLQGEVAELLFAGRAKPARRLLQDAIDKAEASRGEVIWSAPGPATRIC